MPFSIRLAREQDFPGLAAIETDARTRFSDNEMSAQLRGYCTPPRELHASHRAGLLWVAEVAGSGVVGFLAAALLDQGIHVLQMSVRPAAGRMGIGTKLLSRVHQEASPESWVMFRLQPSPTSLGMRPPTRSAASSRSHRINSRLPFGNAWPAKMRLV